jgi:hypothetical protein
VRLLEAVGTLSTKSHAFSISALVRPKSDFITINAEGAIDGCLAQSEVAFPDYLALGDKAGDSPKRLT